MKDNSNKEINPVIEGSILVALVSISAYILVYSYEYGYCQYFNISANLIEINLTSIFIVGSALLLIYFILFGFCSIVSMIISNPSLPPYFKRAIISFIPILLIFLGSILSYGTMRKEQIITLCAIVFSTILILVFPLITQRRTKGYFNKLKKQDEHESNLDKNTPSLMTMVVRFLPKESFYFLFYLYIGVTIAYNHGNASAIKQIDFVILKTQPETVVLRKYGDNFITTNIDRKNRSVTKEFSITSVANNGAKLELEKVGPLRVR